MKKSIFLWLFLIVFKIANVVAQVTIGVNQVPDAMSLLDLKENPTDQTSTKALHFQRMTTVNRDKLTLNEKDLAKGLVIYNTTTNCMEYWNLLKWISLCTGQAAITFKDHNGADAGDITEPPFPAIGGRKGPFVPHDVPDCTGKDPAYSFIVTSGAEYTSINVENSTTGEFSITMNTNELAVSRNAIVRVVNNCTNEYNEFIFTQEGDDSVCGTTTGIPNIANTTGLSLCNRGAVYLYLPENDPNFDTNGVYIWTLGNVEKGRGSYFVATVPGTYTVYADKIGCQTHTPKIVTVSPSTNLAPSPVTILVGQNNGLVCDVNDETRLFATADIGADEKIVWYKNGEKTNKTGSSIMAGIGQWFAVVENSQSGCSSIPSNLLSVAKDPTVGTATTAPAFTINGTPATAQVSLCSGGLLLLDVTNAQAGQSYTWYVNQTVRGTGVHCEIPLAGILSDFILQCQTTGSGCSTATVAEINFNMTTAPGIPDITINTPGGAICNGTATLTANNDGTATSFVWHKSDKENGTYNVMPGKTSQSLAISEPGYYKAIAANGQCMSGFSDAKAVTVATGSATVTITGPQGVFGSNPAATVPDSTYYKITMGETKTYTAVMDNPQGASYNWTVLPGSTGANPTSGVGSSIAVRFANPGQATIKLTATNACGSARVTNDDYAVNVHTGCIPVRVGAHLPDSRTVSLFQGSTSTISITAAAGGSSLTYQWYKPNTASNTGGAAVAGAVGASFDIPSNLTSNTHYYYCVVTGCDGLTATSDVFTVNVKTNPVSTPEGSGSFAGRMSFDIAQTESANCGTLTDRTKGGITAYGSYADFNNPITAVQTYTFTPNGTVSNVRFEYIESNTYLNEIIESISGGNSGNNISNAVNCTVTYKSTLNTKAKTKSNADAMTVDIYVIYNDRGDGMGTDRKLKLTASVKDCFSCGAFTNTNKWLNFMCQNLGASADLYLPANIQNASTGNTYGTYYQWGSNGSSRSTSSEAWGNGGNKNFQYDPCPTGFRVPSREQFASLLRGTKDYLAQNYTTGSNANVWSWKSNTTTQGIQIGSFLFLPAAGYAECPGCATTQATYWSSEQYNSAYGYDMFVANNNAVNMGYTYNKTGHLSVRCVAEKND